MKRLCAVINMRVAVLVVAVVLIGCPDTASTLCSTGLRCPPGNVCTASGDACIAADKRCGDGIRDPDEACDDGNAQAGDGCSVDCGSDESCGNQVVDESVGEACDDAGFDTVSCDGDCTVPTCGDGHANAAVDEECDDGGVDTVFCDGDCTAPACGDGYVNTATGEVCDDGNAGDRCSVDCRVEIMVSAGDDHTCALLPSGAVRCWGMNEYGQLGYGNGTMNIGDDETAASAGDMDVGGPVLQIAAAEFHTCALLASGAVRCWGRNNNGQLGYGNTLDMGEAAASAGDVDVGGTVVQIATNSEHTCALLAGGAIRCWGLGSYGRLGHGDMENIGDNETPASAGDINVGGPVIGLAIGNRHVCALLSGGKVRCWGRNNHGQLGYGNTIDIGDDMGETPASAGDVNVDGTVVQLAAGNHTCALLDSGVVRCWGRNHHGQLGYSHINDVGDDMDETPASAGDVNVGGLVTQIVVGDDHTCALLAGGSVRCWGLNASGQLGYGHTDDIGDNDPPASADDVNVGGPVLQLTAGDDHTCALLAGGIVRCWGLNASGQLGYGKGTDNISDNEGETPASVGDVPWQ